MDCGGYEMSMLFKVVFLVMMAAFFVSVLCVPDCEANNFKARVRLSLWMLVVVGILFVGLGVIAANGL